MLPANDFVRYLQFNELNPGATQNFSARKGEFRTKESEFFHQQSNNNEGLM